MRQYIRGVRENPQYDRALHMRLNVIEPKGQRKN